MALQIWLPLNGTFENYGLLGPLTQTTAPAYTDGAFGKVLTTGGCKMTAAQAASVLNNKAVTICFWVYINAATGTTDNLKLFFGTNDLSANNNRKFSLFNYPTVNDFHWSFQNNTANVTWAAGVLYGVLPSYKWTHVAVTYENPNGAIYINGTLKQTFTGSSASNSFAYDTQVLWNSTYMYRNDFRLYNHCLSAKEVSEIAKGLICHYPLNDPTPTASLNKYGGDYFEGKPSGHTDGITVTKLSNERGYNFKLNYTGTGANTWYSIWYPTCSFTAGKVYDYSCKVRVNSSNTTWQFRSARMSNDWESGIYNVINFTKNVWKEIHHQTKLGATSVRGGTTLTTAPLVEFYTENMSTKDKVYTFDIDIKDVQFCECETNAPISNGSWNDLTIYDTSGFRNHGSARGTTYLALNNASPMYNNCYKLLNGGSPSINLPNFLFENMPQGTVSIWINRHSTSSTWRNYLLLANGYNWTSNELDFIIIGSTGSQAVILDCCSNTYAYTPDLNTWHLYTITWNLTTHVSQFFVDGVLKQSVTSERISTTYARKHASHFIGNASYSESDYSISDFRIYATALTADQIMELYNTPISISNTGTLLTKGEVIEG